MRYPGPNAPQKGAALVVSLIFLMLMTLIGISAFRENHAQTLMAANSKQQTIALNTAEDATRFAEDQLSNLLNNDNCSQYQGDLNKLGNDLQVAVNNQYPTSTVDTTNFQCTAVDGSPKSNCPSCSSALELYRLRVISDEKGRKGRRVIEILHLHAN